MGGGGALFFFVNFFVRNQLHLYSLIHVGQGKKMITGITGRTIRNHNGILYLALSDMLYDQIACASCCILNGMEIGKVYERGIKSFIIHIFHWFVILY